jgi:hypothetical protein
VKGKKWLVEMEIDVADVWLEDGFRLTKESLIDAVSDILPFADTGELTIHVTRIKEVAP